MSWIGLGDALETALAKALEMDAETAGTVSVITKQNAKKAGRPKPAPVIREVPPVDKVDTSRWERTAKPQRGAPPLAVRCHLVVIEGGRTTEGRSLDRPTYSAAREVRGERARLFKLVVVN